MTQHVGWVEARNPALAVYQPGGLLGFASLYPAYGRAAPNQAKSGSSARPPGAGSYKNKSITAAAE